MTEDRPPDRDLVRRALGGDDDACRTIVQRHQTIAFRTAYLITGSAEDARDAVQDGLIKAFRALSRFDTRRPLRPWLIAIVANEARNRARSHNRRTAAELRFADESGRAAAADPPSDPLGRDHLIAAVRQLPEPQRAVVALRYFAGLTEDETAAALGVRLGTVKSRHARALERLRGELGEDA